ncbi:MAG: hypothetical protein KF766_04975 [Rhodocyclaceae bacterium]|nr:hypothetical protein [Rhodocyclaceae bacterium]
MMVAEHIGDHATCAQCNAYAKFNVLDAGRALHHEPVDIDDHDEVWLKGHCRNAARSGRYCGLRFSCADSQHHRNKRWH